MWLIAIMIIEGELGARSQRLSRNQPKALSDTLSIYVLRNPNTIPMRYVCIVTYWNCPWAGLPKVLLIMFSRIYSRTRYKKLYRGIISTESLDTIRISKMTWISYKVSREENTPKLILSSGICIVCQQNMATIYYGLFILLVDWFYEPVK